MVFKILIIDINLNFTLHLFIGYKYFVLFYLSKSQIFISTKLTIVNS